MKQLHWLLLAAGISLSGVAQAHEYGHYGHGYWHGGVGVYFGVPGPYYPYYGYPYPYYPYPPAVIAPAQPPVYVEQQPQTVQPSSVQAQIAPAQDATNYWYYCSNPDGYYPYVKDCPAGWKKVPATPSK